MENWVTFADVLATPIRNGLTKPKAIRGKGVKMIAMGEIFAKARIADIEMDRVPVTEKELANCGIEAGDLLFARQSLVLEGAGKCSIVAEVTEPTVFESHLIRVRVDKDKADPYFVFYYFNSLHGRENIKTIVEQVAAAGIRGSDLIKLSVPCPDIGEQRSIARILRSIDEKIENNEKINDNLQQQAMALYASMFLDNPALETTAGTLKDIAEITMGQSPSGSSYNEDGNGEVFYQGRAEFGYRFPTRRLFTTEPKRMAEAGDVLLSVRAPVGDLNVAYERCCIGRGLGAIHGRNGYQSFVLYTMFALRPQLDVYNGEGTVFGSINRNALNDMPIDIPSEDAIAAFEAVVRPMDDMIRTNYEENCRLQELSDTLLPRLMSGEVDVSDINI